MSTSTALIAISLFFVGGLLASYHIAKIANDLGAQICTGIVAGHPMPTEQRWYMLNAMWTPSVFGGCVLSVFLAFAQFLMANNVADHDVKLLGYLASLLAAVGAVMWLIQGGLMFVNYRSVLRRIE